MSNFAACSNGIEVQRQATTVCRSFGARGFFLFTNLPAPGTPPVCTPILANAASRARGMSHPCTTPASYKTVSKSSSTTCASLSSLLGELRPICLSRYPRTSNYGAAASVTLAINASVVSPFCAITSGAASYQAYAGSMESSNPSSRCRAKKTYSTAGSAAGPPASLSSFRRCSSTPMSCSSYKCASRSYPVEHGGLPGAKFAVSFLAASSLRFARAGL